MYYVPDGTTKCGYYECEDCGERFLSLHTEPSIICPGCGEDLDWEIGLDEEMPTARETGKLIQIAEGKLGMEAAYLTGQIKAEGDLEKALLLKKLTQKPEKKATKKTVKKATAKKTK